jgi:hypothetical protein
MRNLLNKALEANENQIPNFGSKSKINYEIMEEIEFLQNWSDHFMVMGTCSVFCLQAKERIESLKTLIK